MQMLYYLTIPFARKELLIQNPYFLPHRDAIEELRNDHAFLLKGDVFTADFLESYMELKWEEVYNFEHTPHPVEFQMYYSV